MYRYMLDAGRLRQTTLEDELIFLEHYSYLVHVRYPEVEISVDCGKRYAERRIYIPDDHPDSRKECHQA